MLILYPGTSPLKGEGGGASRPPSLSLRRPTVHPNKPNAHPSASQRVAEILSVQKADIEHLDPAEHKVEAGNLRDPAALSEMVRPKRAARSSLAPLARFVVSLVTLIY